MPIPATPDFDHEADTMDRAGYQIVFEEDFTAPARSAATAGPTATVGV